jgi:hypothetical protein
VPDETRDEILAAFEFALEAQLRAVRRLRDKQPRERRPSKKGLSNIGMSFGVLSRAKAPMHVDDLIAAIAQAYGVQPARDSLVSALTKKVVAGDRFEKTAPNTFGLRSDVTSVVSLNWLD